MSRAFTDIAGAPAAWGGRPVFPEGLPFVKPAVPDEAPVLERIGAALRSGRLTNGALVRELEQRAAAYLGVRHCVAVSSCTTGLMLVLRASDLSGEVIVPSFTFSATAHAVAWNGLRPVFADVDPETLTLSPAAVARAMAVRTSAILATHLYGTPCDVEGLEQLAEAHGVRLFFDAAHAFGSAHGARRIGGFGDAEVFSLSPTKVLVAAEGGLIATDDDILAERCRIGRDYANPGDYDTRFVGLNGRMSELHAAVALASLQGIDDRLRHRNDLARHYRRCLTGVPGISFPAVPQGDTSTYKDLTILVDAAAFGLDAVALAEALAAEGIDTRRYYAPPVHEQRAYRSGATCGPLPVTADAAKRVITLPLWADMTKREVGRVAEAIVRIGAYAGVPGARRTIYLR